jgi:FkbM family methyltransferase
LKAYIREGTDDFHLLFTPREEEIRPHLKLNRGETFVDVGANVGYYSLKAAIGNKDNEVRVVAIEAHPETYSALLQNIKCNGLDDGSSIVAINKAVADKKHDTIMMYERHAEDGTKMAGNSSICIAFDKKNSVLVQCDTLDNILAGYDRVDVLKMDIEGAEVMALKGASEVLKKMRKIVVEIHGDNLAQVISILREGGFEITTIPYELNVYVVGSKAAIVP